MVPLDRRREWMLSFERLTFDSESRCKKGSWETAMIQREWAWLGGWWTVMAVACGGSAFSAESIGGNVTGENAAGAATSAAGNAEAAGNTGENTGAGGVSSASGGAAGSMTTGSAGSSTAGSAGSSGRGGSPPLEGGTGTAGGSLAEAGTREAGFGDASSGDSMPGPCPGLLLTVNKDLAEAQTCDPSVMGDNCQTLVDGVCCHVPVASKDSAATAAYLAALATYKSNCAMVCTIACLGGNSSCKLALGGQGYSCQR
jgi:hypothetical protein